MLTDCGWVLTPSLDESVSEKSSGEALAATRSLISHPDSVFRLILAYAAATISQGQDLRSFAMPAVQLVAETGALTSAVNSRFVGLSRATIAGVANRGRHNAASLVT